MERQLTRTRFQGVLNIIRFNWPFFASTAAGIFVLLAGMAFAPNGLRLWLLVGTLAALVGTLISLGVSYYVYDYTDLYELPWLADVPIPAQANLLTINAGFDETSATLALRYPQAALRVYDFYDPARHTEPSIERARRTYPAYPGTARISTARIPEETASVDAVFLIFAAHEIRDDSERTRFFAEVARVLRPEGRAVVVEHLRDVPNFLAYTIGFLHFYSRRTWLATFQKAGLFVETEQLFTPFVRVFQLQRAI
jgi:SAM-dependent methyltransferase